MLDDTQISILDEIKQLFRRNKACKEASDEAVPAAGQQQAELEALRRGSASEQAEFGASVSGIVLEAVQHSHVTKALRVRLAPPPANPRARRPPRAEPTEVEEQELIEGQQALDASPEVMLIEGQQALPSTPEVLLIEGQRALPATDPVLHIEDRRPNTVPLQQL